MSGPIAALLGARLHLQHGPIDLIIDASGSPAGIAAAYRRAWERFQTMLDEMVAELPCLRRPLVGGDEPIGLVARRMMHAVAPFRDVFITPMAAVAGAVADEICEVMVRPELGRVLVNNGGDIAFYLGPGERFDVGVVPVPHLPRLVGKVTIFSGDGVAGVATSGRHGRSFSLGIADSVTVFAADAAAADAAATLIANAVDLPGNPAIYRTPACALDPESDLGDRLVTVDVETLCDGDVENALASGVAAAEAMRRLGLIRAAVLWLQGRFRAVGDPWASNTAPIPAVSGQTFDARRNEEPIAR